MKINELCPNCMNELNGNKCPHCGYDINDPQVNSHALKTYSILNGKYLIGNVIGEGGFGITYIGFDLNLEIKIAVKEFYPNGFVTRESEVTNTVTEYTTNDPERYQKWKDSFVREARNLAKFSNLPGIVHVRDFFQENNTAYIIMEYVEGETLKKYLKTRGSVLTVAETLDMMKPVIKSLARVHQAGIIHRDISPDNIMIQDGGDIKLIDFGAAREFEADNERSMSVLLKPGYAPEEQYRTRGNQGPWTDVYALCATIYRCITGKKPMESMERMREDSLLSPSELGIRISPETEAALMTGLAVYAENRLQNMDALYEALYKGTPVAETVSPGDENPEGMFDEANTENNNATKSVNIHENDETNSLSDKIRLAMSDRKILIMFVSAAVLIIVVLVLIAINSMREKPDIPDESNPVVEPEDVPQPAAPEPETPQPAASEPETPQPAAPEPEPETPLGEPVSISDKELYRDKYAAIVNNSWDSEEKSSWIMTGIEVINLNSDENGDPEVVVLWDVGRGNIIGQEVYGISCDKDSKLITSSAVPGYDLGVYRGDDGSTVAYTENESGTVYLLDSYGSKAFSFPLNNDQEFDYSIREEFIGRVPSVFERAINTPAGWSPDDTTYYKVYSYEKDEVVSSLLENKNRMDLDYTDCYISRFQEGDQRLAEWNRAWDLAWDNYASLWGVSEE